DQAQPAGAQRAGHAQEDRHVVLEHLLPYASGSGEISSLKRDSFHPLENLVGSESGLDGKGFDGRLEEPGFLLRHAPTIIVVRLEGAADPYVHRAAIWHGAAAVAGPRCSDRRRKAEGVAGEQVERQFAADGTLQIARIERAVPCVPHIDERGSVKGMEKE